MTCWDRVCPGLLKMHAYECVYVSTPPWGHIKRQYVCSFRPRTHVHANTLAPVGFTLFIVLYLRRAMERETPLGSPGPDGETHTHTHTPKAALSPAHYWDLLIPSVITPLYHLKEKKNIQIIWMSVRKSGRRRQSGWWEKESVNGGHHSLARWEM